MRALIYALLNRLLALTWRAAGLILKGMAVMAQGKPNLAAALTRVNGIVDTAVAALNGRVADAQAAADADAQADADTLNLIGDKLQAALTPPTPAVPVADSTGSPQGDPAAPAAPTA